MGSARPSIIAKPALQTLHAGKVNWSNANLLAFIPGAKSKWKFACLFGSPVRRMSHMGSTCSFVFSRGDSPQKTHIFGLLDDLFLLVAATV
jgi:hypothetical protein